MKKKYVEVNFDDVFTYVFPLEWFEYCYEKKLYFKILAIYEKEIDEN